MAQKMEVPFANQEGSSSATQNSRERLINMFCEVDTSGRRKLIRRQRMALEQVYAIVEEKRCIEKNGSTYYLVAGSGFFTFDGVATVTYRGTLATSTGPCTMVFDENGDVLISDGFAAYHWGGSVLVTAATNSAVGTLTFMGGFAVYNEPNTGRFWWSAVNDMQSWDGLDFATAEGKPDQLVRVFEDHGELWLIGAETIEIWTLTGGTDSPFSRNATMQRGCGAPLSVVSEDNSVMWLGEDWIFYRADGFRPMRVSNHAVEKLISDLPVAARASCIAFSYSDGGHKFVTLRFPGYLTLQYNVATQFWNIARTFQRDDWDITGSSYTNSDLYLTTTGISRLRRGINKDAGVIIERGGISPQLADGSRRVALRSYFLDCEVGRAAEGQEARVMLRIACDGETFGNERWRSLGSTGNYVRRAVWRGGGIGRRMTVEVMVTDDFEFTILGAEADGDVL